MRHPVAGIGRHVAVTPVTIGTHRLWISLWTRLGQSEDNTARPGGNHQGYGGESAAVHSRPPDGHCRRTGPVATQSHPGLGESRLSPGSTAPTTTTNFFITKTQIQVAGRADRGVGHGRQARHGKRAPLGSPTHATGGSFR